jgi:hypothetical protein
LECFTRDESLTRLPNGGGVSDRSVQALVVTLVFGTALSDPAGYASACTVSRKCLRVQAWVENDPCWFVIDRKGTADVRLSPEFLQHDFLGEGY